MRKGAGILIKTLFVIYIAMVLFFCFYSFSLPDVNLAEYFLGIRIDRICHFIMFFPYPFIAWLTINYSKTLTRIRPFAFLTTYITGLLFAGGTEVVQGLLIENRQGDPGDFLADAIAITLGTIIVAIIGHWMVRVVEKLFPSTPLNENTK